LPVTDTALIDGLLPVKVQRPVVADDELELLEELVLEELEELELGVKVTFVMV
jgi:hypothetical protein